MKGVDEMDCWNDVFRNYCVNIIIKSIAESDPLCSASATILSTHGKLLVERTLLWWMQCRQFSKRGRTDWSERKNWLTLRWCCELRRDHTYWTGAYAKHTWPHHAMMSLVWTVSGPHWPWARGLGNRNCPQAIRISSYSVQYLPGIVVNPERNQK